MALTYDAVDAVVLAGSNIDPDKCVPEAVRHLRRRADLSVVNVSDCYQSAAVGSAEGTPDFVNAAIHLSTALPAEELREVLHSVEDELGRVRTDDPNASRTIDLDIIFYGDLVKDFDGWSVPDPDMEVRLHVAVPVAEVVPDWIHPVSGLPAKEIAESLVPADGSDAPAKVIGQGGPAQDAAESRKGDGLSHQRLHDISRRGREQRGLRCRGRRGDGPGA
jgi:2-amino-4-hydroxy-6-hydroxymethyldihydropteridine diphosphokinase